MRPKNFDYSFEDENSRMWCDKSITALEYLAARSLVAIYKLVDLSKKAINKIRPDKLEGRLN